MNKNTFILFFLFTLSFFLFLQLFFSHPEVNEKKKERNEEEKTALPVNYPQVIDTTDPVVVETPLYSAKFSASSGVLFSFVLENFKDQHGKPLELVKEGSGLFFTPIEGIPNLKFTPQNTFLNLQANERGELNFVAKLDTLTIIKKYTFSGSELVFSFTLQGLSPSSVTLNFPSPSIVTEKNVKEDLSHTAFLVYGEKLKKKSYEDLVKKGPYTLTLEEITWLGVRNKYFLWSLIMQKDTLTTLTAFSTDSSIGFVLSLKEKSQNFQVYLGPIDYFILKDLPYGFVELCNFGNRFISPFAKGILMLFHFLHRFIGNYGWVIVIFSLLMKVVFWPLNIKSMQSMKKMRELQPKLDALKKIYPKDPMKAQKEMMGLYKTHKVNPFSGCLPMLLQLPIFFALYQVLRFAIELRGAPFGLWIQDLSMRDPYYILPILMGLASLGQSMTQVTPTTGQMRLFSIIMPIFMTVIFFNFPAGIVLYWLTYSLISMVEQIVLKIKTTEIQTWTPPTRD